jgi:hypothetical protein
MTNKYFNELDNNERREFRSRGWDLDSLEQAERLKENFLLNWNTKSIRSSYNLPFLNAIQRLIDKRIL